MSGDCSKCGNHCLECICNEKDEDWERFEHSFECWDKRKSIDNNFLLGEIYLFLKAKYGKEC